MTKVNYISLSERSTAMCLIITGSAVDAVVAMFVSDVTGARPLVIYSAIATILYYSWYLPVLLEA